MKNKLDETIKAYGDEIIYYFDKVIIHNWYSKKIVKNSSKYLSVLDLGLGHGITANNFSEHFKDYTILDGSTEIINKYKKEFPKSKANIIHTYFEDYKTEKKFDLIIMGFILEHVDNPILIMEEYKNFLKPEGKIIVTVPNAETMNRRLGYYAKLLDDLTTLSEHDIEVGHQRYYTIETFKNDVKKAGLNCCNIEGVYLKPFTTKQMISLNFDENILNSLCELGVHYPELSLAIMAELTTNDKKN